MLEIKNLCVNYGSIRAVHDISFTVNEGEVVTLIGANGAGKTTTLRTISGINRPSAGSIEFLGEDITKLPPHKIVERGICHVPEGRRIFYDMTVYENLIMGATLQKDAQKNKKNLEWVFELFPRLLEREKQIAGTLSGGEQQMLAVGRALMSNGKMLLLDEPSMGLAPIIVQGIFDIIEKLKEMGMTILLVEQNANMALSVADRAFVLETGSVAFSGAAKDLKNNEDVKKAYLGA